MLKDKESNKEKKSKRAKRGRRREVGEEGIHCGCFLDYKEEEKKGQVQ